MTALLPRDAALWSSQERRAWETLAATGQGITHDESFNEIRRPFEPWDDGFRGPRAAWLRGANPRGWEPAGAAFARFDAGVRGVLGAAESVVIATHGLVLTNWLARRDLLDPNRVVDFWSALSSQTASSWTSTRVISRK